MTRFFSLYALVACSFACSPGTSAKPLAISISLENGTVWVNGRGAVLGSLSIDANADVEATVPATQEATISVDSNRGGDITLKLPATFAADSIVLEADAEKIDTSDSLMSRRGRDVAPLEAEQSSFRSRQRIRW